ncbi:MAG: IS4 family transposase [Proteobacteria bacterium]|nr:IS4 family transposase [Pseudomonadota bacterium]MBU1715586.1 IS4 family transposase [Pseudomonadota bacterium]
MQMDFEHHLKALVYYHLEERVSAQDLLQELRENNFAKQYIAPPKGIEKSSFSEANNERGLEQFLYIFEQLYNQAHQTLPTQYSEFGELIAIDGSLIDGVLSMTWADYRKGSKKAKSHLGFDINRSIPRKVYLTDGKGDERPFVSKILNPGQTGIMDRYYQRHKSFDLWQEEKKHFICRIRANTIKTCIKTNDIPKDSFISYDAIVLLGTPGGNQTKKQVRLVGYTIGKKEYWIATDRFDLTAEQIAAAYKLRWC